MSNPDDVPAIMCGGGPTDPEAVSVWDENRQLNVCGLCGSSDLTAGYGLAGGGGIGGYNFCNGCQRILDKSEDVT
jgi:hypothetical protein